ncbi:zinc-dependent metalloprotease [Pendulispora brunnea]|uniref:Zinc-dependent metalloprotease n=1 Tax=Pendulispora brunnea TaxID=2905690 RepID=A0ABZ2KNQ2_9BACT
MFTFNFGATVWGVVLLPFAAAAGCASESAPPSGDADLLARDQAFVSIARTLSKELTQKADATSGGAALSVPSSHAKDSFYVAINKKELNRRYFLSAYAKQLLANPQPGPFPATSLGTRVVTFRVQNGKLFVFDAQDGLASSDIFDPSSIIEAYPLVGDYEPFLSLRGHDDYVLFDPAGGLNRFGIVSDAYAKGDKPLHFQVDLSYLQNFRRVNDGATFEQVFTGALNDTTTGSPDYDENWYRISGTLGVALRRYTEGKGFTPFDAGKVSQEYYYRSPPLLVKNTGGTLERAIKWNINSGMAPIKWFISDPVLQVAKEHPKYDIVGAIKAGIENWNQVFGFKVFEASVAGPGDSFGDDDKNYFIYDPNPNGIAYADWRLNPNTGEIRGASVYFSAGFFRDAIEKLDPPTRAFKRTIQPKTPPRIREMTWGSFRPTRLCALWAGASDERNDEDGPRAAKLTGAQAVNKYITHIALHEIGHALGLRHNFKGSLVPPPQQSSVMDYIEVSDAAATDPAPPGPYDHAAVKLLYGLSKSEPTQPFCTDRIPSIDPTCATFDRTEDPLMKYWGANYNEHLKFILRGEGATEHQRNIEQRYLDGTAAFLRAGSTIDQGRAWQQLNELLAVGIDHAADNAKYPGYTDRLSEFQNWMLNRVFLEPPPTPNGGIPAIPVLVGDTLKAIVTELRGVTVNSDKYRGWNTRRTSVDVLKKLQTQSAYEALLSARTNLAEVRTSLPAGSPEAMLMDDLLARIDAATRPYYTK